MTTAVNLTTFYPSKHVFLTHFEKIDLKNVFLTQELLKKLI